MFDAAFSGELPMGRVYSGRLVIAGGGRSVLPDMERIGNWGDDADWMAINDVGMFLPRVDHWFSIHGECFPEWANVRRLNHDCHDIKYHSKQGSKTVCIEWPILPNWGPLGGQAACLVALALGYDEIVLCGVPGDDSGHFYPAHNRRGQKTNRDFGEYDAAYKQIKLFSGGRIRSMSGKTKDIFGDQI